MIKERRDKTRGFSSTTGLALLVPALLLTLQLAPAIADASTDALKWKHIGMSRSTPLLGERGRKIVASLMVGGALLLTSCATSGPAREPSSKQSALVAELRASPVVEASDLGNVDPRHITAFIELHDAYVMNRRAGQASVPSLARAIGLRSSDALDSLYHKAEKWQRFNRLVPVLEGAIDNARASGQLERWEVSAEFRHHFDHAGGDVPWKVVDLDDENRGVIITMPSSKDVAHHAGWVIPTEILNAGNTYPPLDRNPLLTDDDSFSKL
jgi:hypothetical protein